MFSEQVELRGHIIDSLILPKVLDEILTYGGSFTIRDIRDKQGYLDALGKPRIAQVKRDAIIAQAEADRDATIKSSQAAQAGQEAKFAADTKIAEANRDYQSNVQQYQAAVNQKKAEADLAYDLQRFKTGQLVKAE